MRPHPARRDVLAGLAATACLPAFAAKADASSSITDPAGLTATLDAIADDMLDASPELITSLGLDTGRRAHQAGLLDDRSIAARTEQNRRTRHHLAALDGFQPQALSALDRVNLAAVRAALEAQDAIGAHFDYGAAVDPQPYVVSHLTGAYSSVPDFLDSKHRVVNGEDADAYLARLESFAREIGNENQVIGHDARRGVTPPGFILDRTLTQLRALRGQPPETSSLVRSLARKSAEAGLGGRYAEAAADILTQRIVPALQSQVETLEALRPEADEESGVWRLPEGEAYYSAALASATGVADGPEALHALGLGLVAEFGARLAGMLDAAGYPAGPLAARVGAFQSDPQYLYPNDAAGKSRLLQDQAAKLAEVGRRLPSVFWTSPQVPVEIRPVPSFRESGAPFAYYEDPSLDGARPGVFYINLRDTTEIPSWMITTTTFHEAVPGHHLQQAMLLEGPPLPLIRKLQWSSAYGEGWALYAEQLADELGMYDDDPSGRIGYVWGALLRAGRLVADTGVHSRRWSRDQAVKWMIEHAATPQGLAVNEVERYCVWPGQACSYMVGKSRWIALRERARTALGSAFDIRDFHQAGLAVGAPPLSVFDQVIDSFIADGEQVPRR